MSLSTTTDEIFAAILESLAYQFVACVDYIRSTRKQPFTRLHFGGGGSRTDKLLQLRADLIQAPSEECRTSSFRRLRRMLLVSETTGMPAWKTRPPIWAIPFPTSSRFRKTETKYAERYAKYKAISADYLRRY